MLHDHSHSSSDQSLLFGILALQANYIDRDGLVDAMNAWAVDRMKPLAQILSEQGKLPVGRRIMIEALVEEKLAADACYRLPHPATPTSALSPPSRNDSRSTYHMPSSYQHRFNDSSTAFANNGSNGSGASRNEIASGLRYRIVRPHARGGLGEIFVARDQTLDREVALKEIQPEHANDPGFRDRFVREAKITGGLEHPGIVPIYSLGTYADGRPFYAMRFVNGVNLKEAIDRFHEADGPGREHSERTLEFRQLLRRFVDICNAIAYAHSRDVLHRDLKPGNVMLGSFGETLIVDWGLAKPVRDVENSEFRTQRSRSASDSEVIDTQPGATVGTPAYMSPEQAAGQVDQLGPAADIYGLGATLYTLLTGRPPFSSANRGELLHAVQIGEFPRPRQVKKDVPPALEAICLKAMALLPANRYASALDLAAAVEHWLADEPVAAYWEPWRERTRRFLRKHRTLATSAAAMLVVTVLLSSGAAVLLNVARAGERQARIDETTQKDAAQTAQNRAEAVAQFLVDAFRLPDPKRNGPDVRVVEVLDRAVETLDKKFAADPATRGRLLDALGETYMDLGLPARAIDLLKRSRELLHEHVGSDEIDTLVASTHLAMAHRDAGEHVEALRLTEEIYERYKMKLGPNHRTTIGSLGNVGHARLDVGKIHDAIPLLEEVVRRLPKFDTDSDASGIVSYMASLGTAYYEAGRLTKALALFEDALRWRTVHLGPDHFHTLRAQGSVAWTYHDLGRVSEAVGLFEQTLSAYRPKFGHDHPATLAMNAGLANAYVSSGRPTEALSLLDTSLPLLTTKLGADHTFVLASSTILVMAYLDVGRLSDALSLMEETLPRMKARHGPDHPRTLKATITLARIYRDADRLSEASALLDDALMQLRHVLPDSPALAATLVGVGECLVQRGKYDAAEAPLREAFDILQRRQPGFWLRFTAEALLGQCLAKQGKHAEAEPYLRAGYEGIRDLDKAHPASAKRSMEAAVDCLAQLCEVTGRPSEAAEWRGKRP